MFDRTTDDADGLSFIKWEPDEPDENQMIINSTELRAVEGELIDITKTDGLTFSIHAVPKITPVLVPPPRGKPAPRQSKRIAGGAKPTPGGKKAAVVARPIAPPPPETVYEIKGDVDAAGRRESW